MLARLIILTLFFPTPFLLIRDTRSLKNVAKLFDVKSVTSAELNNITLNQNNPNPFGTTTRINYSISNSFKKVLERIADAGSKKIKEISLPVAGTASLILDASTFSTGSFTYTIIADGKIVQSKK